MRAKPDMKPWVSTDKSKMSSFRSGTNSVSIVGHLHCACAAPTGLNKCGERLTQGLRPGLCRGIAPLGLFDNNSNKMNTTYSFQ